MQTIQLQSVGHVPAKPVSQFKVGEKMMWNFGYTSTILSILKETNTQIIFQMKSFDPSGNSDGKIYDRRMKKTRLAAIVD